MSFYDIYVDENISSWVLVYFVDSDPGKEFEIIARNRISIPENFVLRPQLKVKVFYGKAKIEAYVVQESNDYQSLQRNFDSMTKEYRDNLPHNASVGVKRHWKEECVDVSYEEHDTKEVILGSGCCNSLQEKYDALKTKFNDLYRMQCVMRSTITELVERVESLSSDKKEQREETSEDEDKRRSTKRQRRSAPLPDENAGDDDDVEQVDDVVLFGEHKTTIAANVFNSINWNSCSAATRKLLVSVFSKNVLATHTLTGKPSPAFLNSGKEQKEQLDPCRTADIIDIVMRRCKVRASAVRSAITTKCADENKMAKKRKRD